MAFNRNFRGIWIPAELWLDTRLSDFEKNLFAEIDSLDGDDHCYANNEYFMTFFNKQERTLQRGLAKLKNLGMIEIIQDKEIRRIKSNLKTIYVKFVTPINNISKERISESIKVKFVTPSTTNLTPLPPGNIGVSDNINSIAYKKKKEDIEKEKSKAADAAQLTLSLIENIKKINPNFSDSTQTWEKTWITLLNKREKSHLEALMKWAFTDFWGGVIVSPRSLYTNLSKIEAQWQLSKIKAENPKKGEKNLQSVDMKYANEIYEKTRPRDDIRLGPDYIEFEAGMATKCFKFGEDNFKDKCLIELGKRKIKL